MSLTNFFQNKDCPYFPCHKTNNKKDFNCFFCYCPLYALGDKCGGNFYRNKNNIKVCTNCLFVHEKKNTKEVIRRIKKVVEMVQNLQ